MGLMGWGSLQAGWGPPPIPPVQHPLLEWEFLLGSLRSPKQVTQPRVLVPLK